MPRCSNVPLTAGHARHIHGAGEAVSAGVSFPVVLVREDAALRVLRGKKGRNFFFFARRESASVKCALFGAKGRDYEISVGCRQRYDYAITDLFRNEETLLE